MFTQEEIEDLKRLPVYNRVGGVVHRVSNHALPTHFIEMPAVNHDRFRCSRYGHIYVAFTVRSGWFQYAINLDADTKLFKDWVPNNRIIDDLAIVPWTSVKCIRVEYRCHIPCYTLSFGSADLPVLKFNSREEAELVRDELVEEWESLKGIRI